MKSDRLSVSRLRLRVLCLGGALGLPILMAGCAGSTGGVAPPTPAQRQQQVNTLLNDPHVPDSVKQHMKDQEQANQRAAQGYTADMQKKPAGQK
ncbi:MAG TPA: hypothetical protein VFA07_17425 [Chthonomonadaceae bacterium]|nr:hypothetical protein [Chthonomonadaceae bacterium]